MELIIRQTPFKDIEVHANLFFLVKTSSKNRNHNGMRYRSNFSSKVSTNTTDPRDNADKGG
jgi:hypothetical protein